MQLKTSVGVLLSLIRLPILPGFETFQTQPEFFEQQREIPDSKAAKSVSFFMQKAEAACKELRYSDEPFFQLEFVKKNLIEAKQIAKNESTWNPKLERASHKILRRAKLLAINGFLREARKHSLASFEGRDATYGVVLTDDAIAAARDLAHELGRSFSSPQRAHALKSFTVVREKALPKLLKEAALAATRAKNDGDDDQRALAREAIETFDTFVSEIKKKLTPAQVAERERIMKSIHPVKL